MKELDKRDGSRVARRNEGKVAGTAKWKRPQGRRPRVAQRRMNAGFVLIAGITLVVTAVWLVQSPDEIHRGVRIGEVGVGGMSKGEARGAIERQASTAFEQIRFGDGIFTVSGEQLGVKIGAEAAVDEAYAVGREGWAGRRAFEVVRAYFLGGVQVDPAVEYEEAAARSALEDATGEFYQRPQNATFYVTDDGRVEVQEARDGRVLNEEGTLANLDRALASASGEVPIAADDKKPEVSTQEIEGLKPTEVIGEYKTDFLWDSNPSRQANLRKASGAIDGTLLAPGEVFSFNDLTSPLDYEKAKTFSDGGVGFANGGGLCQVSSTLYMAATYAGLEIVERNAHYAVLPYIRPGLDATVWFGGEGIPELDMRFKNTTGTYVLVREYVDKEGFLRAEILGQPTGKKVEMRSERIFEDPNRGIKWTTYKKVTGKGGEVLRDGFLYSDVYSYNPPAPEGTPHYKTKAPRVAGWSDPNNTTGWADVE
jgi:vancomycin resistance protein YoaR